MSDGRMYPSDVARQVLRDLQERNRPTNPDFSKIPRDCYGCGLPFLTPQRRGKVVCPTCKAARMENQKDVDVH